MSVLRALLLEREARAAFAVWALVPAVFLFFNLTLAIDPTAHLDKLTVGVANLDAGVTTPLGQVSVGEQLVAGIGQQLGAEVVPVADAAAAEAAVLDRDVSVAIVVPAGMTQAILAGQPTELSVVRSDANDPFTNNFTAQLPTVLSGAIAAVGGQLPIGGEARAEPAPPLATVATDTVAAATDFRFATVPAFLLLPLWLASVVFAVLLSRAGDAVRPRFGAIRTGAMELAVAVVAAGTTALVVSLSIAGFTWQWGIDLVGLFAVLWLGLAAIGWLVLGAIRALGLALGAALGILALFLQQPVSGAQVPAAMAPDVVAWLEPFAPLRYLIEAIRNTLIGGTTTAEMATALAIIGLVGLALAVAGMGRLRFVAERATAPVAAPAAGA